MKSYVLMVVTLMASVNVRAECQIFASQQKVTWNTISAAERQQAKGQAISLPEKQIQVQVVCGEPHRIRLFPGSNGQQSGMFSLGSNGEMHITASHARVDDKSVRIAPVQMSDETPPSAGSETFPVTPDQGLAFMDGHEVYGKTASLTLTVLSKIKPGTLTDRTTWRGNLHIRMDIQ